MGHDWTKAGGLTTDRFYSKTIKQRILFLIGLYIGKQGVFYTPETLLIQSGLFPEGAKLFPFFTMPGKGYVSFFTLVAFFPF